MDSNFNLFISFDELFNALCTEHNDELDDIDSVLGREILKFGRSPLALEIDINECDFSDDAVVFVFSHYDNNANESDTQGSGVVCTIVYDRMCECFTNFESEGY